MLILSGGAKAQVSYIVTDTALIDSIKIVDRRSIKNSQLCERIIITTPVFYTPYDILEYGLANGMVYISKDLTIGDSTSRVFLERLATGKITLYYYRNEVMKFYILEKEGINSIQMPKKSPGQSKADYKDVLDSAFNDCSEISDAVKLTGYQKKKIALLTERYNKCSNKPFPFFKIGVLAGYGFSDLNYIAGVGNYFFKQENKYFKNADFKYDGGVIFGLFIDQPISVSDFSIHPEIYFTSNNYFSAYEMDDYYIEVKINTSSINFPLLFRYALPFPKARPYLNAGIIYAYQFKDDFSSMTMPEDEGEYPAPVVTNQIGLSAGAGYQIDLNYRMRLYIDLRYNYLYGLRVSGQESYQKNEFQFTVATSF